jgi:protein SCO1/2/putative membrane protein
MPSLPRLGALVIAALLAAGCRRPPEEFGAVGPFALTGRDGRTVTEADLKGKVWVASTVFTRCTTGCPSVSKTMARLQKELRLAGDDDLRLVTFTVDPERDGPDELREYAKGYDAHPERWLFLTGEKEKIHELLLKGFRVSVGERLDDHSTRLILVDQNGVIRGYFPGLIDESGGVGAAEYENGLRRLRSHVAALKSPVDFPLLNASLNFLSGVLLVLGYAAIRRREVTAHKWLMLSALCVSAVFLGCYLYYHIVIQKGQSTRFAERAPEAPAWVATTYYVILISHILLAVPQTVMALVVAYLGLRDRLERHVKLARWTFPVWLYVSVTGVVVYWMLYRLYPWP